MARRRMIVFVAIIILGVIIGVFCLPGGVDSTDNSTRQPEEATPAPQQTATVPPQIAPVPLRSQPAAMPALPKAEIMEDAENAPEAKFFRAASISNMKQKLDGLVDTYKADPKGRWGGEAAAMIGFISVQANPERAAQWLQIARQNPVSTETRTKINAELKIADSAPAPQQLAPINVQVSEMAMIAYKVQPNDNLWVLGKRYGIPGELIKMVNKLPNDKLQINQSLKIPEGPFHVVISKSNHTLQLMQNGKVVKAYRVALGKDGGTPVGEYNVTNKLENPKWYSPEGPIPFGDPRNMLGTRWIGFAPTYGIHGTRTQDENTIGTDASAGCVRMLNREAEEVYNYLIITKSKVTVVQ